MADAILTINAGSSSLKFSVQIIDGGHLTPLSHGEIECIGSTPHFVAKNAAGDTLQEQKWQQGDGQTHETLLGTLLRWAESHLQGNTIAAVGHRVVHGGTQYDEPARVTDAVLADLDRLTQLAPLHQPHNLAPIRAIAALRPKLPQVVCFDTAFHHAMPPIATRFALPRRFTEDGVRRYGFHGLSYNFIARRLKLLAPDLAAGRVVAAHLGNGASLCAMQPGRSIDTTMGFTALDGLVMGTRCGSIDPGAVIHLQRHYNLSASDVETILYQQSGLCGVSGISGDVRTLEQSTDPAAAEALELFVYEIVRHTGALVSVLGGIDGFIFAGIGEHSRHPRRGLRPPRLARRRNRLRRKPKR